ncbi:hypothetical protein [Thomasclavelia cocleata]|uniref:hypothetical protein n=1 Tax=Thomasclavelia cocleata TaxID=69824 RepID=UPI00272DF06E|nr:hypothetical protein [Thomasclavelia cocleata]
MIDIEYSNAYVEVLEILKCIPTRDYNKIPKSKIELFVTNANSNYKFNYDLDKTLDEQNVSKIAKGIIAILFRDYWATDEQRQKIIAKQNYDRNQIEKSNRLKYNPDNVFKNKSNMSNNIEYQSMELTKYKEDLLSRLLKKIKNIFYR